MADLTLPMFRAAALKGNPSLTDSDVSNLYNMNASKLVDLDPMSQMKAAMDIGASAKDGATPELPAVNVTARRLPSTDTSPEEASLRVPVRTQINTELRDPYAGTSQATQNPGNPGASGLSQFDPTQSNAANAEYERRIRAMQPGRDVSDWATSAMTGSEGATASARHQAYYQQQQDLAKDLSVGQQGRLQEQATAGGALAGKMQDMSAAKGRYETEQTNAQIEQAGKRADLVTKELTTAQQQRLDDPDSVETAMAKEIAKSQMNTTLPESAAALTKIINQPGVTARQIILATGTLAPEAQKALVAATGIKNVEAGTEKIKAEVPGVAAESAIKQGVAQATVGTPTPTTKTTAPITISISDTPLSSSTYKQLQDKAKSDAGAAKFLEAYDAKFNAQPLNAEARTAAIEQGKILQQQLATETDPTKKLALSKQLSDLTTLLAPPIPGTPALQGDYADRLKKFGTISAGGVNIPPNPANAALAGSDAAAIERANQQVETYTQAQPTIKSLRKALSDTGTGTFTDVKARLGVGGAREVANLMANFNTQYPGMLGQIVGPEMANSIAKGGFTGGAVNNLSTEQMTRFLDMVDSQVATANNIASRRMGNVAGNTPGAVAPMPQQLTQPGAKPTGPGGSTVASVPTVTSQAQYDALPKGARYKDTNGTPHIKGGQ